MTYGHYAPVVQLHLPILCVNKSYATKATIAAKEQKEKQRLEITQLVRLLRQIETQVNSHHGDIRQTLADHRRSLHKSFQKAISYIAAIHHSCQNQETLLFVLNVFQITLRQVDAALNAVESGVEDLMQQLAQQMCNPLVEYVKRLKTETTLGTFARLLAMVEEMEREIRDGRVELEEERMKVRVAEKKMLEALTRLTELEDRERMKEQLGSLLETRKSYTLRPRKVSKLDSQNVKKPLRPIELGADRLISRWSINIWQVFICTRGIRFVGTYLLDVTMNPPHGQDFYCSLCQNVMRLPVTTPCAHNFCKDCVQEAFAGKTFVRKRLCFSGQALRSHKNVMKCPSCPADISEFLQNPQKNETNAEDKSEDSPNGKKTVGRGRGRPRRNGRGGEGRGRGCCRPLKINIQANDEFE
uniref:RING-type domain-containing protein n=1 Tax=Vitis vinifera TaxID=29760 RepID=A5C5R9_VITVI|nr:hypothetical protein VITISV_032384 [Vitis vinifera]